MLLQLPTRLSYDDFVETVSDQVRVLVGNIGATRLMYAQLTTYERAILQPDEPLERKEALRRFYLIWTLKEAYTKALGLGLGFDFKRIEYDVPRDVVRIDNVVPAGWKFTRFDLQREADAYVGVVARYVDESRNDSSQCDVEHRPIDGWIRTCDASDFLQSAIHSLTI